MTGKKPPHDPPHNPMTQKNNKLSSAQEVLYNDEFKRAENTAKDSKEKKVDNLEK